MNTIRIVASDHPVASVVVLKSSKAEVARTFDVSLKSGRNKLTISKLPTTIEKQSVRISILDQNGAPVAKNKIYLSDIVCSLADNAGDDPTKEIMRALEVKKSGLESEKRMLSTQAEVMVTYARSLNGNCASPDVVDAFLDAFSDRGKRNIEAVMKIEEQIMEIDKKIREEKRKRASVKGSANSELVVVIVADSAARVQFHLTYVVNNTRWSPTYELHAVTGEDGKPSRTVSLHYHASIKQATGEDWTNASLTLSTVATDTVIKKIPALEPVTINTIPSYGPTQGPPPPFIIQSSRSPSRSITPPRQRGYYHRSPRRSRSYSRHRRHSSSRHRRHSSSRHRRRSSSRDGRGYSPQPPIIIQQPPAPMLAPTIVPTASTSFWVSPNFSASEEEALDDDDILTLSDDEDDNDIREIADIRGRERVDEAFTKLVTQTPMTLTYAVRGRADIPSDGKEHVVTIAILTFEAEVEYVSVPRVDPRVFLQCQVKNTSEYRLLPGPVSVILDQNYVSRTRFSDVNRNDTFTFTLGDDPSITISYERVSKTTKEGTYTFAESIDITTYTTTITAQNTHQFSIEKLIVRDTVPISINDKRIKVVLRKPHELVEAKEGVFVHVENEGEPLKKDENKNENGERLEVKWEKEQDGLYAYKWRVGANDTAKFETVFDVKGPADLKYQFSNFDIQGKGPADLKYQFSNFGIQGKA